jgi:uncharacterized membrane protein
MSVKQRFLDQLRAELRTYPSGSVDDYVEYYDELLSERIANGEPETEAVQRVGKPKDIAASFKRDNAIDKAVKKPTLSNGFKAVIAVLSVLSLPILAPVLGVAALLVLIGVILFGVGLIVLGSCALTAVVSVIEMITVVAAGDAPIYLLVLNIGVSLLILVAAYQLIRGMMYLGRKTIRVVIGKLKKRRSSQQQHQQASEEQ